MRHKIYSLDCFTESLACVSLWQENKTPDMRHRQMLTVMKRALPGELTARQQQCVQLYYYEEKTIYEIAEVLKITAPTVCKHLKKARIRLSSILKYYFSKESQPSAG